MPSRPRHSPASDCADLIGSMKAKMKVTGDVFSNGIGWNAES
jgi:hypothetical protein